jgi:flavin reductase (DIM6/NTAB) family NADH-FMN oxidoreductase RutF
MSSIFDFIKSPVSVVTSRGKNRINGMTAAWVAQVSMEPPTVMMPVYLQRFTHDLIQESRVFAINLLGAGRISLAKSFG